MLIGVYGNTERYIKSYWSRFPNRYYTGDYAIKDDDGYFWILGRADEVLKVAGHRIGTAELENAAISHPQVTEAAVIGKPDPIKGTTIVLFAVLKKGVTLSPDLRKDLANHMRKMLGPIATPGEVYFATKLPKTRSGKIMRRILKAVATDATIGDLSTLEDETSVEEILKVYKELKKAKEEAV